MASRRWLASDAGSVGGDVVRRRPSVSAAAPSPRCPGVRMMRRCDPSPSAAEMRLRRQAGTGAAKTAALTHLLCQSADCLGMGVDHVGADRRHPLGVAVFGEPLADDIEHAVLDPAIVTAPDGQDLAEALRQARHRPPDRAIQVLASTDVRLSLRSRDCCDARRLSKLSYLKGCLWAGTSRKPGRQWPSVELGTKHLAYASAGTSLSSAMPHATGSPYTEQRRTVPRSERTFRRRLHAQREGQGHQTAACASRLTRQCQP